MFQIYSLKDNMTPVPVPVNTLNNYQGANMDPVTIISAASAGWTLISNIFGSGRKALTMADWNQIFPYSGAWYSKLKAYMSTHIKYNTDENNISSFMMNFIYDSGLVDTTNPNVTQRETTALNWLNAELQAERNGGTTVNTGAQIQPVNTTQSGVITTSTGQGGTLLTTLGTGKANISSPALLAVGAAVLLFIVMK